MDVIVIHAQVLSLFKVLSMYIVANELWQEMQIIL